VALLDEPYPKLPLGTHIYFDHAGNPMIPHDATVSERLDAAYQEDLAIAKRSGYVRHLATHIAGDKYALCTIKDNDEVDRDLGERTRSEMIAFLRGHGMFPHFVDQLMQMLELDGNKVSFPAPAPMLSASKTSKGQP
jgi:hypothetical protein